MYVYKQPVFVGLKKVRMRVLDNQNEYIYLPRLLKRFCLPDKREDRQPVFFLVEENTIF